ncbi:ABC transporter substrate-binding protein [Desulfobacula phenolica]|uniref:ABC-type branched-chain amino acid transport system, substrate-binding protein n=1 Tax=Desulfobacula phenolica TaxID=90732 RepID=A0A1H2HXT9_9BACT|nr:ABC transporter substrate-binding protein [Desulfobacula phenolica]SDU36496.1 ABC-type branched-chain amino acid transport system, substrate-binding protein [Desulfobacula phenolica]
MKNKQTITHFGIIFILSIFFYSCSNSDDPRLTTSRTSGVTSDQILIGSSLALGGHAGYLGTQTLHGALACLNHVNDNGGIHGRKIKLIAYDDGYDPPRCVANTQKLIVQDKVFCLFGYVGTPTTVKIVPLVEDARIPILGMFTGANALREPLKRYLINVRASYYQETGAAVKHLVEKMKLSKIAVFYQYDAYGFDGLKGTEIALKLYGLVPVATGSYIRGTLDVEEGLEKIMDREAQAVVMIGTYEPCAKFIRLARSKGFSSVFYNVSFVGADELARILGYTDEQIIVTQVVPPPEVSKADETLWGAREYIDLLKKYYPLDDPNFVSLEGYINAKVFVEGLKRAGRDLDRENFINAIETIRQLDLGIANPLSFNSQDHQGLERVYFTYLKNGKFVWLDD